MKATASLFVLAGALLAAACAEGRAIFNVDVYSFLAGTGQDTIPYIIPPFTSGSASNAPQTVSLPGGFGSSIVDSVRISSGSVDLINTGGTGTLGFQLYIAADSLGALNPSALALTVPPTNVSGPGTTSVPISGDLSAAFNSLFSQSTIWARVAVAGTNAGATPVTGDMALTALRLRIVFQDKLF
jgi:hypothetical protein